MAAYPVNCGMFKGTIRVARESDAEAMAAIYAPIVQDTGISFEVDPPGPEEMARRLRAILPTHPWLVAEQAGRVIGYAYSGKHRDRAAYRWSVDVSAYVDAQARRKGAGLALYETLIVLLKQQGFHSAFAGIALPNEASVEFHQAAGFTPLGIYKEVGFKQGQWRDVGWWRLGLSNSLDAPGEPIAFEALPKPL